MGYKEGLISDFKVNEKTNTIKIKLKYIKTKPLLTEIKLISKPQLQKFADYNGLKQYHKKFDYFFVSTSNGIVSSKLFLKNKKKLKIIIIDKPINTIITDKILRVEGPLGKIEYCFKNQLSYDNKNLFIEAKHLNFFFNKVNNLFKSVTSG